MAKKKGKERKPYAGEISTKEEDKKAQKKTYSLASNDKVPTTQGEEAGLCKVELSGEREAAILDLILESKAHRVMSGAASKRVTSKKLKDFYSTLQRAGFKHGQIEAAMAGTVQYGGDLIDALDWLCLHVNNDQLPDGFSEALSMEETKKRPKFKGQETQGKDSGLSSVADERANLSSGYQATMREGSSMKGNGNQTKPEQSKAGPGTPAGGGEAVKDWILRYTEQSDESEEEAGTGSDTEAGERADTDVNSQYLVLAAQLADCKCDALEAKTSGDKSRNKQLSKKIRDLQEEISVLERHHSFDKRCKISFEENQKVVTSQKTNRSNSPPPREEDTKPHKNTDMGAGAMAAEIPGGENEDVLGCFALMEEQQEQAPTPSPAPKPSTKKAPLDKREFEYTRKQWTGKSPKQFLIDWVRKHLPKSPPPSYNKVCVRGNLWRSRCRVVQKDGDLDVCPDIVCENVKEAEHLASTLALYRLCKGQKVYQLLPPPYRTVWIEWQDLEDRQKEGEREQENKPRDQFISKLMKKLKLADSSPEQEVEEEDGPAGDVESWEDINEEDLEAPSQNPETCVKHRSHKPRGPSSSEFRDILKQHQATEKYTRLLKVREELPVYQNREKILAAISQQDVVVIAAETGSGKSTQVPQLLLQELVCSGVAAESSIICTEPRRISATSLATRVCDELGGPGPGASPSLCGYQIRFEVKRCPTTRLLYCTTGVLLRQLQQDPLLTGVNCVIVDEVHERSVQSDFLLIILKEILKKRRDFKVILMSATLDAEKFSAYFLHCPVICVEGRTHPVHKLHLEEVLELLPDYSLEEDSPYGRRLDHLNQEQQGEVKVTGKRGDAHKMTFTWTRDNYFTLDKSGLEPSKYSLKTRNIITRMNDFRINMDLILEVLLLVERSPALYCEDGAVLVFLPGLAHIQELYEKLTTDRRFSDTDRYRIIPLHSVLASTEQNSAFVAPPRGVRKVVLATNIAETGITIPDVVCVIDSGKVKEKRYNEMSQMSSLDEVFVSQAGGRQRAGRAGRVREGVCFRLYTQERFESLRPFTVPELLRVPLEELCLHIMKCDLGEPSSFLSCAVDPPKPLAVSRAMSILREVGACRHDAPTLTPLGRHLAALPVDVRIGKMLVYGAVLGCVEPTSVVAAAMSDKSPFVAAFGRRDDVTVAMSAVSTANSDQLTLLRVYYGWQEAEKGGYQAGIKYCNKHSLKRNTLIDIRNVSGELVQMVGSIGFHPVDAVSILRKSKSARSQLSAPQGISHFLSPGMIAILKAVLTAGLYPQVAKISYEAPVDAAATKEQEVCSGQTSQGPVSVHPQSINRFLGANGFLLYHQKVKGSRVYIRDTTLVRSYPLLLFGGEISVFHKQNLVSLDKWIKFKAYAKTAVIFKELRLLLDGLLERKLSQPELDFKDEPLVHLLLELIVTEK